MEAKSAVRLHSLACVRFYSGEISPIFFSLALYCYFLVFFLLEQSYTNDVYILLFFRLVRFTMAALQPSVVLNYGITEHHSNGSLLLMLLLLLFGLVMLSSTRKIKISLKPSARFTTIYSLIAGSTTAITLF